MAPEVKMIPIGKVVPDPNQPRKKFDDDAIADLARSIAKVGILQPIRVLADSQRDWFLILSGESRFQAGRKAGLPELPCIVVEDVGSYSETDRLADQLIENICRKDLDPVDEARGIVKLRRLKGNCTGKELAEEYGLSQSAISRAETLCRLPEPILNRVGAGKGQIPPTTAVLLERFDDQAEMAEMADRIASGRISRDAVAKEVRERLGGRAPRKPRLTVSLGAVRATFSAEESLTVGMIAELIAKLRRAARNLQADEDAEVLADRFASRVED